MAIIVDRHTRLVVQGATGREGSFHTLRNRAYGTNVVAGVTPGKGRTDLEGLPIFDTVAEAVAETGADTTMVFVPARFAADAIYEAVDAGIVAAGDEGRAFEAALLAMPRGHGARPEQGRRQQGEAHRCCPERETTPMRPSRKISAGMIPTFALPGERAPGQFGPSIVMPCGRMKL